MDVRKLRTRLDKDMVNSMAKKIIKNGLTRIKNQRQDSSIAREDLFRPITRAQEAMNKTFGEKQDEIMTALANMATIPQDGIMALQEELKHAMDNLADEVQQRQDLEDELEDARRYGEHQKERSVEDRRELEEVGMKLLMERQGREADFKLGKELYTKYQEAEKDKTRLEDELTMEKQSREAELEEGKELLTKYQEAEKDKTRLEDELEDLEKQWNDAWRKREAEKQRVEDHDFLVGRQEKKLAKKERGLARLYAMLKVEEDTLSEEKEKAEKRHRKMRKRLDAEKQEFEERVKREEERLRLLQRRIDEEREQLEALTKSRKHGDKNTQEAARLRRQIEEREEEIATALDKIRKVRGMSD